jgi:hypothetical protein
MALIKFQKIAVPVGDENGILKWCIGHKLGDNDPALESHQGRLVIFDTVEEAKAYIDDDE